MLIPAAGLSAQTRPLSSRPVLPASTTLQLPGGIELPCPDGWTHKLEHGSHTLTTPAQPQNGAQALFSIQVVPWQGPPPSQAAPLSSALAQLVRQRIPTLGNPTGVFSLGTQADGAALTFQATGGQGVHVIARVVGTSLVLVVGAGPEPELTTHGPVLAGSLSRLVAPRSVAAPYVTPRPVPQPISAPGVDANLVGTWRSGDGWVDRGSGTSFATETVFDLRADGTFVLGSQSAGGDRRNGLDTGFQVGATGRWSAANGVLRRVNDHDRVVVEVPYSFHQGRLVLHLANRKYSFWSR